MQVLSATATAALASAEARARAGRAVHRKRHDVDTVTDSGAWQAKARHLWRKSPQAHAQQRQAERQATAEQARPWEAENIEPVQDGGLSPAPNNVS